MATKTVRIVCSGLDETDFHLASTTFASNFTSSVYPYSNAKDSGMIGDHGGGNYARINVDKTARSISYFYVTFDFSSIPADAKIVDATGMIRLYSSGTYVQWRRVRWCLNNSSTLITNSQNYSTDSNPDPLISSLSNYAMGDLTLEKLESLKCYVTYERSSRADNTQRYIYLYGACVDVTYEVPDENTLFIKQSDLWIPISKIYLKTNGSWVEQEPTYLSDNSIAHLKRGD